MSEENRMFETWQEVIVDFFENRVENIQGSNPKITCKLYKARKFIDEKEKDIKSEKDPKKLERLKKAKEKKEKDLQQLRVDAPSIEIRQWMEQTSQKPLSEGKRIIKASHVLKFSHGSSEASGLLLTEKSDDTALTTSSLRKALTYDLAHSNGNLITKSRFLALKVSGDLIIDLILEKNDFTFLKPFCKDKDQLDQWQKGFAALVEQREIKTADKAKQIYFPIDKPDDVNTAKYHLLAPLFPSALAEEIYTIANGIRYGEEQKTIRECKKPKPSENKATKYHPGTSIEFPGLGVQKFGGAQPQNISMLNKNRSGKAFVFSTQPPAWQSQLKPPVHKESLFDVIFLSRNTRSDIDYLREFLLRFERIGLSIKNPERQKWVDNWVANIIDELLFYAASIQNLPAGWSSEKIKLKKEHRYFLDPYREDAAFQTARKAGNWQTVVCNDFARWLNGRLRGKDKQFTPQREHSRMWSKQLEQPLREYDQSITMDFKVQNGGEA